MAKRKCPATSRKCYITAELDGAFRIRWRASQKGDYPDYPDMRAGNRGVLHECLDMALDDLAENIRLWEEEHS